MVEYTYNTTYKHKDIKTQYSMIMDINDKSVIKSIKCIFYVYYNKIQYTLSLEIMIIYSRGRNKYSCYAILKHYYGHRLGEAYDTIADIPLTKVICTIIKKIKKDCHITSKPLKKIIFHKQLLTVIEKNLIQCYMRSEGV
jgi:hypothetical protein